MLDITEFQKAQRQLIFLGFRVNLPVVGGGSAVIIALFFISPDAANLVNAVFSEKILNIDMAGIIAIMCSAICYLHTCSSESPNHYPWKSVIAIGLLIDSILLFMIFMIVQIWFGERVMLVNCLLKDRSIYEGTVFMFFLDSMSWIIAYCFPV